MSVLTAAGFYVTGGTLRADAPCYVERRADQELYAGLARGEFCYILTARQMGKSSLMARTASRLPQEGVAVVRLDLTAIGQNVTVEQWYDGLLRLIGWQLDIEEELDDYWQAQDRLGSLQRWMAALRDVVLARVAGRLVVFIDADRDGRASFVYDLLEPLRPIVDRMMLELVAGRSFRMNQDFILTRARVCAGWGSNSRRRWARLSPSACAARRRRSSRRSGASCRLPLQLPS